ncbi:MAG: hypothetical protein HDS77_08380 [Bacteroidales bacterium]|nr:hypothetical protein [Bacteroidales bacterium]MBD5211264.1 hypothetical protein [Bacteroidales bacterium]
MAKFKMTVIANMPGEQLNPGDTIIIDTQRNSDYIDPNLVKQAVKDQLGKNMVSLYSSLHKGSKWSVTEIK